jgi:hypothetical protein
MIKLLDKIEGTDLVRVEYNKVVQIMTDKKFKAIENKECIKIKLRK